jgi:hypothetical protein
MAFNPDNFLKSSGAFNPDEFLGISQEPVSTTEQMVGLGSPIARFAKGAVANPLLAINQAGGAVMGAAGKGIEALTGPNVVTQGLQNIGQGSSNVVNQYEQATQQARQRVGSTGLDLVELGGNIASPFNKLLPGSPVTQATTGAVLNPVVGQNLSPFEVARAKIEQAAVGAAFGKTFEAAIPAFKEGARKLLDAGAELQPGQAFGGAAGGVMRTAEGLRDTLYKLIGKETDPDSINKAFTYVTVNEALGPVGKTVSKTAEDGFALVNKGLQLARKSYDEAFSKVGTVTADTDFMSAINSVRNTARDTLDAKDFAKFEAEINKNVVSRFESKQGVPFTARGAEPVIPQTIYETDGQGLHNIKRFLQARLENLSNSTDELGMSRKSLYEDIMGKFKDYTYRIDPTGSIKAADTSYANMYRVAGAAKSAAKTAGNFSPEQLATTAASQGSTLGAGTGTAPLQQYAKQAIKIIGKDKTDALTPSDLKNLGVATGAGYAGFFNPVVLGIGGLFGLTTEALGKLALKNPDLYQKFRNEAMKNTGLLSKAGTSQYTPTEQK